jgi:plasmid stability protein
MMVRTQITLETELQRRARQRASEHGVSLAEYVRRLVARDLARPEAKADVTSIFDLGSSGGSNIAVNKDSMIAEAFASSRSRARR